MCIKDPLQHFKIYLHLYSKQINTEDECHLYSSSRWLINIMYNWAKAYRFRLVSQNWYFSLMFHSHRKNCDGLLEVSVIFGDRWPMNRTERRVMSQISDNKTLMAGAATFSEWPMSVVKAIGRTCCFPPFVIEVINCFLTVSYVIN